MTTTITANNGAGSTTPTSVLSPYSSDWESRNIIHDLIGGGIAVSLVAPRPRSGTYEVLYQTEEAAYACVALHREETTFTLADTDRPSVGMTYVLNGQTSVRLDPDTLEWFIVTIGYQEVIL